MYKSYYNLLQNPFQLNANVDFFFESTGHKRAKAYLRYGLVQGDGFVVVTGAPGTGKTMLVKELSKSLEKDKNIIIGLMITSQVGAEDTLRILAASFKVNYEINDNKAILLSRLESFFKESACLGRRVLLVVDEAQNLPKESIEELRMLSNYEWEGKVIFQVFLVGQEELGQLIYSPEMDQVKQRVVATFHLKAIQQNEIKEYIRFRLKKAGWQENPRFLDSIFTEIYHFTKGIPRRINTLCDRLLLYGFLEEISVIDLKSVKYVISEIEEDYQSSRLVDSPVAETVVDSTSESQQMRVELLEDEIAKLKNIVYKERALLRKAIILQLDMNQAFSDD